MLPVVLAVRVRGLGVGGERVAAAIAGLGGAGVGGAHRRMAGCLWVGEGGGGGRFRTPSALLAGHPVTEDGARGRFWPLTGRCRKAIRDSSFRMQKTK